MEARLELPDGLSLRIADSAAVARYPTGGLQRGLLLYDGEQELGEEGVGFGVPVLKRGTQTVFPGAVRLHPGTGGPEHEIIADYQLGLVERLARSDGRGVRSGAVYAAKDSLAALHRRVPILRGPLTAASSAGRRALGWTTTYEPSAFHASVPVTYTRPDGDSAVAVTADLTGLVDVGVTEVVFMNELGAREFDRYEDADGTVLCDDAVGTWDAVTAPAGRFVSSRRHLVFSLAQAPGARLRRGRELVGSRLSWAGFGYSVPPALGRFAYEVRIERLA